MKKNILATTIALTALVGYITYEVQSNTQITVLSANVEALADDTGEATEARRCYIKTSSNLYDWKLFCNDKTNDDYIFPCSKWNTYYGYKESLTDRCTK